MTEQILELSALAPEREKARLSWPGNPEGEIYELARPEDLGAVDLSRLGQMYLKMEELWSKEKLTKAEGQLIESNLDKAAGMLILGVPKAAAKALPTITKRTLVIRFLDRAGDQMAGTLREMLTLGSSAPDSNSSTEGTP